MVLYDAAPLPDAARCLTVTGPVTVVTSRSLYALATGGATDSTTGGATGGATCWRDVSHEVRREAGVPVPQRLVPQPMRAPWDVAKALQGRCRTMRCGSSRAGSTRKIEPRRDAVLAGGPDRDHSCVAAARWRLKEVADSLGERLPSPSS
jgi:hypothetical protein